MAATCSWVVMGHYRGLFFCPSSSGMALLSWVIEIRFIMFRCSLVVIINLFIWFTFLIIWQWIVVWWVRVTPKNQASGVCFIIIANRPFLVWISSTGLRCWLPLDQASLCEKSFFPFRHFLQHWTTSRREYHLQYMLWLLSLLLWTAQAMQMIQRARLLFALSLQLHFWIVFSSHHCWCQDVWSVRQTQLWLLHWQGSSQSLGDSFFRSHWHEQSPFLCTIWSMPSVPVHCPCRTLGTILVYLNHPFDCDLFSFAGKDHPFWCCNWCCARVAIGDQGQDAGPTLMAQEWWRLPRWLCGGQSNFASNVPINAVHEQEQLNLLTKLQV